MNLNDIIERVARGRIACLKDNEEPNAVLISLSLKNLIEREAEPYMAFMQDGKWNRIMGLLVEWTTAPADSMSIRTVHGDVRRI